MFSSFLYFEMLQRISRSDKEETPRMDADIASSLKEVHILGHCLNIFVTAFCTIC
jgi:hypothetical protein